MTTPRYSTAIVPDTRGVIGYGGIDPARLFGPGQRVAANLGGTPPGAFGVVVEDARGRTVLASQRPRSGAALRLVRSPRGPVARRRPYPAAPHAGPFSTLEARGAATRGGLRIDAAHRFRRNWIESRWRVTCAGRCGPYRVRVHFPTWGAKAVIEAVRRDGSRMRLASPGAQLGTRIALSEVAAVRLGDGYRLVPRIRSPRATLLAVPVPRERTNPHPGPSLAVEIVPRTRFHARTLAVRIVPWAEGGAG